MNALLKELIFYYIKQNRENLSIEDYNETARQIIKKGLKETNREIEEEIEENQEPIKIEKQKTEKGPNLYRIYRFGKQKLVLPETALKNLKNQLNQIK